jgi:hypothetical protein
MHDGIHRKALRIDENAPFFAFDLLAAIKARRIDPAPLSALLTLWLSMMAAVGLASRFARSRQST